MGIYWFDKDKMKFCKLKIFLPYFVILVISFWALRPLMRPGFFTIHDGAQVARVMVMVILFLIFIRPWCILLERL